MAIWRCDCQGCDKPAIGNVFFVIAIFAWNNQGQSIIHARNARDHHDELKIARQWVSKGQEGFDISLNYQQDVKIPMPGSHNAILIQPNLIQGINGPSTPPVIPGCDGTDIVQSVGACVRGFCVGDRILTRDAPKLVGSHGDDAFAGVAYTLSYLGHGSGGTLRSQYVFSEADLVHVRKSFDWVPVSTLIWTWTTTWNALFG
ncbi:uncharacterized protein N7500_008287 [Penicillium coprophilum]|uniref:uncharacterized protein n=1 Tax=Penicillium coprophilum TaxID=36646 RepID=UPI00238C0311|nr:uncharacterized protein N7500_008287 [Penicillium coprophilum]KAJ5158636.1 hypothetical protein N7500_008287 [Penicillium coprophilum]